MGPLVTFDSSSDTKETVSRARELLGMACSKAFEPLALDALVAGRVWRARHGPPPRPFF